MAIDKPLADARQVRLQQAVANRCQSVWLVLDGLSDAGNINACLRTAEGFGLLNVHIIDQTTAINRSGRTDAGAAKWLRIRHWSCPADCLAELTGQGFRLVGLSLQSDSRPIGEIDFKARPVALVLGNEHRGLSPEFIAVAEPASLPLVGLVQSYNVSVAAALAIQTVFNQRWPDHADLSLPEQQRLLADYNCHSPKRPPYIIGG